MKFGCFFFFLIALIGIVFWLMSSWGQEISSVIPSAKKSFDSGVETVGDIAHSIKSGVPAVKKSVEEYAKDVKRFFVFEGLSFTEYDEINNTALHKKALSQVELKNNDVNVRRLKPQMDSAMISVVKVYWDVLGDDYVPVITSGNDYHGHGKNSKHYKNSALDFRLNDSRISSENRDLIAKQVKSRLGRRYYVLREAEGTSNEHLHVQYNGK